MRPQIQLLVGRLYKGYEPVYRDTGQYYKGSRVVYGAAVRFYRGPRFYIHVQGGFTKDAGLYIEL